jgi:hypothetical protein
MPAILPASWRANPAALLPPEPQDFDGPSIVRWLAFAYLLVITTRSCIHMFWPDGGAHSIATIDIAVAGGHTIVALFGQWGAIQLLLGGLLWVLLLRYPGLTPLVLCVFLAEPFLRGLAGHLKPVETVGTAPGAALNWYAVPLFAVAVYVALCPGEVRQGSRG